MNPQKLIPTILAVAALACPAFAESNSLSHSDKSFFEKAAKSGMKEVEVSQSVEERFAAGESKDFAAMMVKDHTALNQELTALAQQKGVTLPVDNEKYAAKWDKKGNNDKDLAEDYFKEMVSDHKDAVELFEKAAKSDDPDIAAFARKNLPTLRHHLEMAEMQKKLH